MKNLISYLMLFMILGCSSSDNKKNQPVNQENCKITEKHDKTITGYNNVTQLDFVCDETQMSSFNFYDNNPYKDIDFPIIKGSTKYYKVHKYYPESIKKGNIDFNITDSSYLKIQNEIHHDLSQISDYKFKLALTNCDYRIDSIRAIVTYYISIYASKDSLGGRGSQVFFGGKLVVLNNLGETELVVDSVNYAITDVIINDRLNSLYFKTSSIIDDMGKVGFCLINLTTKETVINVEFDSNLIVQNSIYNNEKYVLIRVKSQEDKLKRLYVIDLETKRAFLKKIGKKHQYSYPSLSGDNLILGRMIGSDAEGNMIFDTIKIIEMNKNTR